MPKIWGALSIKCCCFTGAQVLGCPVILHSVVVSHESFCLKTWGAPGPKLPHQRAWGACFILLKCASPASSPPASCLNSGWSSKIETRLSSWSRFCVYHLREQSPISHPGLSFSLCRLSCIPFFWALQSFWCFALTRDKLLRVSPLMFLYRLNVRDKPAKKQLLLCNCSRVQLCEKTFRKLGYRKFAWPIGVDSNANCDSTNDQLLFVPIPEIPEPHEPSTRQWYLQPPTMHKKFVLPSLWAPASLFFILVFVVAFMVRKIRKCHMV